MQPGVIFICHLLIICSVTCRSSEEIFWRRVCRLYTHHTWVLVSVYVDWHFILFCSNFLTRINVFSHFWRPTETKTSGTPIFQYLLTFPPNMRSLLTAVSTSYTSVCNRNHPASVSSRFYCRMNNATIRVQQRIIQEGIKNKVVYEGTDLDPTNKPRPESPSGSSWPPALKLLPLLCKSWDEKRFWDTVGVNWLKCLDGINDGRYNKIPAFYGCFCCCLWFGSATPGQIKSFTQSG